MLLADLHAKAAETDRAVRAVVEAVALVPDIAGDSPAAASLRGRMRRVRRADPVTFDARERVKEIV